MDTPKSVSCCPGPRGRGCVISGGPMPLTGQWFEFNFRSIIWVDEEPAVYVIFLDNNLAYIGSTNNLARRIKNHIQHVPDSIYLETTWGRFKRVTVKASYYRKWGDWTMRELRLIRRLQPPKNKRT